MRRGGCWVVAGALLALPCVQAVGSEGGSRAVLPPAPRDLSLDSRFSDIERVNARFLQIAARAEALERETTSEGIAQRLQATECDFLLWFPLDETR